MTRGQVAALIAAACIGCGGGAGDGPDADGPGTTDAEAGAAGADTVRLGAPGSRAVFTCDDGYRFAVRFRENGASLVLPASTHDLALADAPGRYRDDRRFLRILDDDQARYESPDGGRRRCSGVVADGPREESALLGYDYRAVGQEPGWTLEIDEDRWLRFIGDYGATTILAPVPAAADSAGARVLHAVTDGHDLRVVVLPGPCEDVMSGEPFPDRVEVTVDGVALAGCGELLTN